jgi:hypothetical protein
MVKNSGRRRASPQRSAVPDLPRALERTVDVLQAELGSVELAAAVADAMRATGRFLEELREAGSRPPPMARMRPMARRWLIVVEAGMRVAREALDGTTPPHPRRESVTRIPVSSSPRTTPRNRSRGGPRRQR